MERRIKGKGASGYKERHSSRATKTAARGGGGDPREGLPIWRGKGKKERARTLFSSTSHDLFGSWAWSPSYPQGGVWVAFGSCCRGMWIFRRWIWESSGVSHIGSWLSTCFLGDAAGPPRAVGLSFLLRRRGHHQLLLTGGVEQRALGRGNS